MHAGAGGGAVAKTPMLGVEIGGGMAADCTHAHLLRTSTLNSPCIVRVQLPW